MEIIFGVFGIIIITVLANHFAMVKALRKMKMVSPSVKKVKAISSPDWDSVMESPRGFLSSKGFEQIGFLKLSGEKGVLALHCLGEVWYESESRTFAVLQIQRDLQPHWPWRVGFYNLMSWGEILGTHTDTSMNLLPLSEFEKYIEYDGASWKGFYETHFTFLASHTLREKAVHGSLDSFVQVLDTIIKSRFQKMIKEKVVESIEGEAGVFQYSKKFAKSVVGKIMKRAMAMNKSIAKAWEWKAPERIPPKILKATLENQLKKQELDKQKNPLYKLVIFVVSLIGFALFFGWGADPQFLLILIAVLFIHEIGHAVLMKIFGYKDLSIFFIPFLGAAATGTKSLKVRPWQELLILLGGPLPGLALGLSMAWLYDEHLWEVQWFTQFVVLSVALNGMNLLPFSPMDGGRIVDILLFRRLPKFGAAFMVFSAMGMGLLGYLLETQILYVLPLFLLLSLKKEMNLRNICKEVYGENREGDWKEGTYEILVSKIPERLPFGEKLLFYKELKQRVFFTVPNWRVVLGMGGLYVLALFSPVVLFAKDLFSVVQFSEEQISQKLSFDQMDEGFKNWYVKTCEDSTIAQMSLFRFQDTLRVQVTTTTVAAKGYWEKEKILGDSVKLTVAGPLWFPGQLNEKLRKKIPLDHLENREEMPKEYWDLYGKVLQEVALSEDSIWNSWSSEEKKKWVVRYRPHLKNFQSGCLDLLDREK